MAYYHQQGNRKKTAISADCLEAEEFEQLLASDVGKQLKGYFVSHPQHLLYSRILYS